MSDSSVPPMNAGRARERLTQLRKLRNLPGAVLASIACGGSLGASARFGLTAAFPHPPDGLPWATLSINTSGCLLIGAVMVLVTEVWSEQRLLRPFLGVGVLGGYTTFSTYTVDIQHALAAGAPTTALTHLGVTLVAAMLAVLTGSVATGKFLRLARGAGKRS